MKKLLMINEFESNVASNVYDDVANLSIAGLNGELLVETLRDAYAYIMDNKIDDVVFIARNEIYIYLTELLYHVSGGQNFETYVVPLRYLKNIHKENIIIEDIMVKIDITKPRLSEFQVHLNDHCNLNCKGCGHYCPVVQEPNFLKLEKYDNDLCQIRHKFWGVGKIYLLGGEPLLHPKAAEFAAVTRKRFPDADIRLYTNGLLLDRQKEEFWKIIQDNDIRIEISLYTPSLAKYDKIEAVLKENDAWDEAVLWDNKQQFSKSLLLQSNGDKEKAYQICTSKICHFLRDGYLALCPAVFMKKLFWQHYGMEPQYSPEENAVNLYDENITGRQIQKYLDQPNEACYFCGTGEWFDWDTRTRETVQITDWVVDRGDIQGQTCP